MARDIIETVAAGDVKLLGQILAADPMAAAARDPEGVSVLMHALYRRRSDMVDVILATQPDLDVFELAALGRTADLAPRLADDREAAGRWSPDGFTPLHLAAFFAHAGAVRILLDAHADPGAVARSGSQVEPLHSAVAAGDRLIVELLLEAGADPNAVQHGGWTPLHAACLHGDTALAQLLLAAGASRDVTSADGSTPADLARREHHDAVVDLLG
jgi:uncharacterized protein